MFSIRTPPWSQLVSQLVRYCQLIIFFILVFVNFSQMHRILGNKFGCSFLPKCGETYLKRNLNMKGTCLQRKTSAVPRIQASRTSMKPNLPAEKKNLCGCVVGSFHCTTGRNLVPETDLPEWTFSLLSLGPLGQCWVRSFKYRTQLSDHSKHHDFTVQTSNLRLGSKPKDAFCA